MSFIDRLYYALGFKASQARIATSVLQVGQPQTSPQNEMSYMVNGFSKNATVYACVEKIAQACAGIDWQVYSGRGKKRVVKEDHELDLFLDRPNPLTSGPAFIESVVAYLLLTGNSYVEGVRAKKGDQFPNELWSVKPDKMKIIPNNEGYPGVYQYAKANGGHVTWPINPVNFKADILHIKLFNPLNLWFGMSPLTAAMLSVDSNNAGILWNLSSLQNSANPSGVLQVKTSEANPTGSLNEKQIDRLKKDFDDRYAGARNSGRPMVLEGGMEWKQISLSPKEMDFIKGKEVTEIDICKVFGVPPELLGLGQKTYANYEEARLAFYLEVILPLMDRLRGEFNNWLFDKNTDTVYLDYNRDDIEALRPLVEKLYTRANGANYLTQNEKRELVGYEAKEGWDIFAIGNTLYDSNANPLEANVDDEPDPKNPNSEDEPETEEGKPKKTPEPSKIEDEEDDDGEPDEKMQSLGIGFKNINLINRNEKRASARRQNALRKTYEQSMYLDVKEELSQLAEKLSDAARGIDPKLAEYAMLKVLGEEMPELKKVLTKHLTRVMKFFGYSMINQAKFLNLKVETKATDSNFNSYVEAYVKQRAGQAVQDIEGTTAKKIRKTVAKLVLANITEGDTNADLADALLKEFDGLSEGRARTIARTEVASASNDANLNAAKALEIPGLEKEWVIIKDDRTRDGGKDGDGPDHDAMDGVTIPIEEKFTVPPDTDMDGPGDPSAGAEQICNCRCVLVFNVRG